MNYPARLQPPAEQPTLYTVEGEAMLLGALMSRNAEVDRVCEIIKGDDFAEGLHGRIFDAIVRFTAEGKSAGPISLFPLFERDPAFVALGGNYLGVLTGGHSVLAIDCVQQAEQIADLAARRRLIDAMAEAQASTYDVERPLAELIEEADAALVAAVEKRDVWEQPSAADALDMVISHLEAAMSGAPSTGALCGISDIDKQLGGFEEGQVIILAGRPGMGKTAVACSMALGLARQNHGTVFVSLEMKSKELGMRMASDLCSTGLQGIPFSRLTKGNIDRDEFRQVVRAREDIKEWPLRIIDAASVTTARLALGLRRHKRRMASKGVTLRVAIIDYLQLLSTDSRRPQSAYERVSEISRSLKIIAKDLGITIVALAQLSRAVKQRDDKRPQLSDLRDSGQIEQDADAVIFLYREEYYLRKAKPRRQDAMPAWEQQLIDAESRIDFICPKVRNGVEGTLTGYYYAHYQAVRGSDHLERRA